MKSWLSFRRRSPQRDEPKAARGPVDTLPVPHGTDWGWRADILSVPLNPPDQAAPANGTTLCAGLTVWHDGDAGALSLHQHPHAEAAGQAPFALRIEHHGLGGGFLSFSQDLPPKALSGLTRSHVLRLYLQCSFSAPVVGYARLNIGHGPNFEQVLRQLNDMPPDQPGEQVVEFDLAYTEMSERRLNKIWLDLIFEAPVPERICLHEMVLSRHYRAEM